MVGVAVAVVVVDDDVYVVGAGGGDLEDANIWINNHNYFLYATDSRSSSKAASPCSTAAS